MSVGWVKRTLFGVELTSANDSTRTLQSLAWSKLLAPAEATVLRRIIEYPSQDVSVLEVRIVAGRSSTLVSNQARCIQVAA
jgi:hypothetical protein